MVLHIGIDCEDSDLNRVIIDRLTEFYSNKKYTVGIIDNNDDEYINTLLNDKALKSHEILLLNAFSRSFHYYDYNWESFDLCFSNGTIVSDFQKAKPYIPDNFLKQINRFFPNLDLYILISNEEYINKTNIKNLHQIPYSNDDKTIIESIVKIIFDNLPRCNWCGKLFTKSQKNKKYCSSKCKKYSLEEQYRKNNRNYYHRYKDVMSERSKGQLGSRGANLHGTADLNPLREMEKVRNAKKALGLKPIK